MSQVGFEVLAHYLPASNSTRIVLVDDARLLGPDGVFVLDFEGTIDSTTPIGSPSTSRVPFLGGRGDSASSQTPDRGRLLMGAAVGKNTGGLSLDPPEKFLDASEDGRNLTLVFGLLADPGLETSLSAQRKAALRVSVVLTRDRTVNRAVPTLPAEPAPVEVVVNSWRNLLGLTTGPSTWEMVTTRWPVPAPTPIALHSIASCLNSDKADEDLFAGACDHFLRARYGCLYSDCPFDVTAACDELVFQLHGESTEADFRANYLPCAMQKSSDALDAYEIGCRCGDRVAKSNGTVVEELSQTTKFNACPNEPTFPRDLPGLFPGAAVQEYFEAVTCAMRVASFDFEEAYTAGSVPWFISQYETFDRTQVHPGSGDLFYRKVAPIAAAATPPTGGVASTELWSGAPILASQPLPPLVFPLFDSSSERPARDSALRCIADLRRAPPAFVDDLGLEAGKDPLLPLGDDVRERLAELFSNEGCVDKPRLLLELAWLSEASALEINSLTDTSYDAVHDELTATRLIQHRLKQWLDIHAFVARHVADTHITDSALAVTGQDSAPIPYTLEQMLEVMESGWSLLLHPEQYAVLTHLMAPSSRMAEVLALPDYRVSHVPAAVLQRAASVSGHSSGLPVVILETIAAHLRLATSYLRDNADEIFLECSSADGSARRARIFTKAGEAYRWGIVMQGVANAMVQGMRVAEFGPEDIPWHTEWMNARRELGVSLDGFTEQVVSLQRCENPIGADETSLPLYFIDPQGTNQKFFASSDYLIQGFAAPAVSEARSTFEAMRSAVVQARDAEIRAVQTEEDKERKLRDLAVSYGRTLADACGLETSPEVALERFLGGEMRLDDCHRVPGDDDPNCADMFERVWSQTQYSEAEAALPAECGLNARPDIERLDKQRMLFCGLGYSWRRSGLLSGRLKSFAYNSEVYWDWAFRDSAREALRAGGWGRVLAEIFGWTSIGYPADPTIVVPSFPYEEQFALAPFEIGPWELFDEMGVDTCHANIVLPEPFEQIDVAELLESVLIDILYWDFLPSGTLPPSPGSVVELTEEFGPALVQAYTADDIGGIGTATWCEQMYLNRGFPGELVEAEELLAQFPEPTDLASCYRGDLAGHELSILVARQAVREAKEALATQSRQYNIQANVCMQLAVDHEKRESAHNSHRQAMNEIRRARAAVGFFGSLLKIFDPKSSADALVGATFAVAGAEIERSEAAANNKLNETLLALDGEKEAIVCWAQASSLRAQMQMHIERAKQAYLGVTAAYQQRAQRLRSLANLVAEARVALDREQARGNTELRHHFWLDERTATFEKTLEWARRVVYLAMRALEYEVQASLGIDAMILGAKHPQELEDALRELQRTQASRGINGNRPEEKTVVFSLRDELLQLSDRFYPGRSPAEKQMSRRQDMIDQLKSPNSAVFDNKGNYLGRALRFHLKPKGPLEYRCAERVWGVSATIEGDLFGVLEPRLPVFLLKQNSFQSQWCEGQSPDGERYQPGAMRPSMDLFRPGTQKGQPGETEAWSWAFVDAWLNVPRRNFASEVYSEGDSDELAGRGLYGEYMLLFPAWGFLDTEVDLDQLEDVLLRFEYVSVSNGPPFGPAPSDPEASEIRSEISEFSVQAGMCDVEIRWTPPNIPRFDGVEIYRDVAAGLGDEPPSPLLSGQELLSCDAFAGFCRIPNLDFARRDAHYAAYAFDDWGDVTSAVVSGLVTSPSIDSLVPSALSGSDIGGAVVSLEWTPGTVEECAETVVYRSASTPVAEVEGNLVYAGPLAEYADATVPGTMVGELRKWNYLARTCLGGEQHCSGSKVELPAVLTHYFSDFVSSGSWGGWNTSGVDIVTLAGEEGAGVSGSSLSGCMRRNFTSGGTAAALAEEIRFEYILDRVSGATNPSLCVDISIQNSGSVQCTMTSHWTQLACMPVTSAWASVDVAIPAGSRALSRQLRFRMARSDVSDLVGVRKLNVWAQ